MILWRRHPDREVYKRSQNFIKGNTRKISAVFLYWLLCGVIKFPDYHARMCINDPLASSARASERRIVFSSYILPKATLGNIMTLSEKKIKTEFLPYGHGRLASRKWAMMAKFDLVSFCGYLPRRGVATHVLICVSRGWKRNHLTFNIRDSWLFLPLMIHDSLPIFFPIFMGFIFHFFYSEN